MMNSEYSDRIHINIYFMDYSILSFDYFTNTLI